MSLFEYDNGTFVVESFLNHPVAVRISGSFAHLQDVTTGVTLAGEPLAPTGMARFFPRPSGSAEAPRQYGYELQVEPHSFRAFRQQP